MASTEYLKKQVNQGELALYQIFGAGIASTYNKKFTTLVLPEAIRVEVNDRTLHLPYYEGETFNDSWDITNGGAPMGQRLAREMAAVIKDLAHINTTVISNHPLLATTPQLAFNHSEAVDYFSDIAAQFVERSLLTHEDYTKITKLLAFEQTTAQIVNNGDFYPRNLIKRRDGKVVLIDWETWNDHSPFYIIDHPENVAAVAYVHMWGNPAWQELFRTEIDRLFDFSETSFKKGIAIKALTLAHFFGKHIELLQGQLKMIKDL